MIINIVIYFCFLYSNAHISHLSKALFHCEDIRMMLKKCLSLLRPLSVRSAEKRFDVCVNAHVFTFLPPQVCLPRVLPPPIIWLTQITWCPQILLLFCRKTERLVLIPVCHGLHVINKWNQDLMERIVLVGFVHILNSCYFTSHKLDTW